VIQGWKVIRIFPNEVHLWYAYDETIRSSVFSTCYLDFLSEKEKYRHQHIHVDKHRHQYLITRALVRTVLSLYVDDVLPKQWEFSTNIYGKPYIKYPSLPIALRFNLSHTEKLVVLAVSLDQEIGVDAEYLAGKCEIIEIAKEFFSKIEVDNLLALPKEKQQNRFFDLWTLKEAYIKASGKGLYLPLDEFSYSFLLGSEIAISFDSHKNDKPENWQFWQIKANNHHKVSVAINNTCSEKVRNITMRVVIPLLGAIEVNYPIAMQSAL